MAAQLRIPLDLRPLLLPDPNLSILDLVTFRLPVVISTRSGAGFRDNASFFSSEAPTVNDVPTLRSIPIPPQPVVQDLLASAPAYIRAGKCAITCPHINQTEPRRLPLFILAFWSEVHLIHPDQRAWTRAEASLRKRRCIWEKEKDQDCVSLSLITKTYDLLASTPWNEVIRGFSDNEPLTMLSSYAIPTAWLSTFHENQMLELLQQELVLGAYSSPGSLANLRLEIETLGFFPKMREAYQLHRAAYATAKTFRFVRGTGTVLANSSGALGSILHVRGNHWVSIVVDFAKQQILYGDPKGQPIDPLVRDVVLWWAAEHSGVAFTVEELTHTVQPDKDNENCGILAFNSLAHHVFPETYMLAGSGTEELADERLRWLHRVLERHIHFPKVHSSLIYKYRKANSHPGFRR